MQTVKETAANISASAQSGLEKTKAIVEEKVEKMSTRDPMQKEMATQKKGGRIQEAEMKKQEAREHNAASKQTGGDGGYSSFGTAPYTSTGGTGTHSLPTVGGQPTGGHQMSALPGHGTGSPAGQVVEGTAKAHPIGGTGHAYGTGGRSYTS